MAIYGILPQLAGALVGMSVLAYAAGWSEASAYFDAMGAPWAISLLSPAQIMEEAAWLIIILAFVCYFSIIILLKDIGKPETISRWVDWITGLAATIFLISSILEKYLGSTIPIVSSMLVAVMMAISAGLAIGELISRLSETSLKWDHRHLYLIYFIVFFGLWMSPGNMGRVRAKDEIDPGRCKLPKVTLAQSEFKYEWRLVKILSDKILLVRFEKDTKKNVFKVVSFSEINEIQK